MLNGLLSTASCGVRVNTSLRSGTLKSLPNVVVLSGFTPEELEEKINKTKFVKTHNLILTPISERISIAGISCRKWEDPVTGIIRYDCAVEKPIE
jgi:hypothetical protein